MHAMKVGYVRYSDELFNEITVECDFSFLILSSSKLLSDMHPK